MKAGRRLCLEAVHVHRTVNDMGLGNVNRRAGAGEGSGVEPWDTLWLQARK